MTEEPDAETSALRGRAATPQEVTEGDDQRWRAVAVVLIGGFMGLLDTTIVTVAEDHLKLPRPDH